MRLNEIYRPVQKELNEIEAKLREELKTPQQFVSTVAEYMLSAPGKRLRPALVLLSARVGDFNSGRVINLAASVELIHAATLIQDDVIDRANKRRGKDTVRKVFGDNISILFGDYLYSRAFGILSRLKDTRVLLSLSKVTNAMAAGEMEQLYLIGRSVSEQKYFEVIRKKTANLFSACCETGGIVAKASSRQIRALADFGLYFGMAFQIIDDCLDRSSAKSRAGKSLGLDQEMGKVTLPVIYDSAEKAVKKAEEYIVQANRALEKVIPFSRTKPFLELGNYVLSQVN